MDAIRKTLETVLCATILTFVVCSLTAVVAAQGSSAAISGVVRDSAGLPLAGVTIRLENAATGDVRLVVSGERGLFEFGAVLPAGRLTLHAALAGFHDARVTVQSLAAGDRRIIEIQLEVASVTEVVQVAADVPFDRTPAPELGGFLTREQIERVPLNGRDLIALAYLIPGAAPARGFYNLAPRLTINGSSSLMTNYSVDGLDNTDLFLGGPKVPVTVGSTENLEVMINSYSTEYGRSGNGVFAVTTRSGSNQPLSAVFSTWRPGAVLDAPNVFAPRTPGGEVIDDSFRRYQGGFSAGGPLEKNRAFYFVDAEITRERQDAILTSPLASGLAPTGFDSQTAFARSDLRWSDRHASTLRYQFSDDTHDGDRGFVGGLTLPSAGLEVNYRSQFASFIHRTVRERDVNELAFQVGQLRGDWRSRDPGPRVVVTDRGASVAVLGSVSDDFFWTERDLQVRNVFTRVAGRHTIKSGADLLWAQFFIDSGPGARGAYVIDLEGRVPSLTGPFLTREDIPTDVRVLSYSQSFLNPEIHERQLLGAAFVEDVFRPFDDVTITAGLRWDVDSVTDTPLSAADWNNIAPRAGFNWSPAGSERHQIRGGYGVFYERIPFAVYSDTLFNNPDGGAVTVTFAPGTPFAPPTFPRPFSSQAVTELPLSQLPPRNVQVFDPDLKSPWTEQISLGHVLSISQTTTLAFDYVQNRSRNLMRRIDINAPASLATGEQRTTAEADLTRPTIPAPAGFRLIEQDQSSGRGRFHALYVSLRRRLASRVAFDLAYTLSRAENDTDDINFRPVDSRRADDEFAPSLNDRRHVLAINGVVQLPLGFDVAPVVFVSSGQPLNVTTGRDDNGDTVFNDRPAGVGRNSERSPGFSQVDLSVVRQVRLGRVVIDARAEVFNVFNRANFSGFFNWGASGVRPDEEGTLAFQPTQAGPPRQFQFTGVIRF